MLPHALAQIAGPMRPGDARRFVIEAMLGAAASDGISDPRELAVLERHVSSHPLFAGLSSEATNTLVELANDAIRIAGGAAQRAPAIAKGLSARWLRLTAYAMASEVCIADSVLAAGEVAFLEALRVASRIGGHEAQAVFAAVRTGQVNRLLEDQIRRLQSLVPVAARLFALRAQARSTVSDAHRFSVVDFFTALPDLALAAEELDVALYREFRRPNPTNMTLFAQLVELAKSLPDPIDRYWMVVYALVAEMPATVTSWRVIPFIGILQGAFAIADADIEFAVHDALAFPPALPRPS